MKWLAIRAGEEDLRAALRGAGVEVIEEGDARTLAAFLERAASVEAHLVDPRDAAVLALVEGEDPVSIVSDRRLVSSLADMATTQVAETGGCLLDLREFGLSADTARLVAERAGLRVSIGLKAVFTW